MKEFAIAFLVCLACTCWVNGESPPYPVSVGVSGVAPAIDAAQRDDIQIPELKYVDSLRKSNYLVGVRDSKDREQIDFRIGAGD
jgi:hypothetical protein